MQDWQTEAREHIKQLHLQLDPPNQEPLSQFQANRPNLSKERTWIRSKSARHNKSNLRDWYPISIEAASIERSIQQSLREERELLQKKLGGFRANLAGKEGDYSSPHNVLQGKPCSDALTTKFYFTFTVRIAPLRKARQELREEIGGFDIALRAKQQEKFQTSLSILKFAAFKLLPKKHNGFNVADTCVKRVSLHQVLSRVPKRQAIGGRVAYTRGVVQADRCTRPMRHLRVSLEGSRLIIL
ncbi:hypothetical protein MJO28_009691 [Puccinia striiformis f. sp. tritici]|uniref:Uncharacterized protein n=2 Tax=Puccinia striiformis f. sp. tritici TaxID=168172 RepID=A0ACC0E7S4_9BASI|nr:hypothetical protein MJO28_009669 [Puccinia striiformis f. sp. tritici]KAI7947783.1 hypothetical protein MJO28_009691 [Puccinia striiformis f. sp. tritici]